MRLRYSRWDGTQDPIGEDLDVHALVDELSEDLLAGADPDEAMASLLRRGMEGRFDGIQSLLDRIRAQRRRQQQQGRLDGFLSEVRETLEQILEEERTELSFDEDPEARMREGYLDSLPPDPAGRITGLKEYDFKSQIARQMFNQLLEKLQQEVLASTFKQMAGAMKNMSPEDLAAMREMLGDLNRMLDAHRAGTGPSQEQFDKFMARHGRFFPENPRTMQELLEVMARRMAAMSRLLASLSPEQRAELQALSQQLLSDLGLAFEVDRLGEALRELFPNMGWDEGVPMQGDRPLGLAEGLEAIERLSDFDEVERALRQDYPGAALEDVDVDKIRRTLGDDAVRDVENLRRVEKALEQAGIVSRQDGRLELTPRGVRKLGERALTKVFERLQIDRPGRHDAHAAGGMGEPTGATRAWQFGDPFQIDVRRTVQNAVIRGGASGARDASGRRRVSLSVDDFETVEAESLTSTATVLLLDMSFSMPMRGNWVPAKRMALALHSLIATKYPQDHLDIVGFSDMAHVMRPEELAQVGWEHVYGTNMEHAFNLAGRLLAKHARATKQVLLVTDGEPTAHLLPDGTPFFRWPPVRETLEKTYAEALRLAKAGIVMNIFMLEDSPALFNFVDKLARVVSGRVFAVGGDELGELIVKDYLRSRAAG
jgi:uncharacterized protein with von Willebrand factor type A (vWA) domain